MTLYYIKNMFFSFCSWINCQHCWRFWELVNVVELYIWVYSKAKRLFESPSLMKEILGTEEMLKIISFFFFCIQVLNSVFWFFLHRRVSTIRSGNKMASPMERHLYHLELGKYSNKGGHFCCELVCAGLNISHICTDRRDALAAYLSFSLCRNLYLTLYETPLTWSSKSMLYLQK